MGLVAAIAISWATRGPSCAFGIAEWIASFGVALVRSACPAAVYLLSGLGMGWWVRRFVVKEMSGPLAACVGVSILLTLSHLLGVMGLVGGLGGGERAGTVVAWLVIGLGLSGLAMDWRSVRASVVRVRVSAWHVPALVLVLGVLISASLAPPGWLWQSEFGGYDVLSRERALDDGLFEVYTFPARSRLGLLRHALRATFGRFPSRRVALHRARRVTVRAPGRVPFQVDGDLAGETPFELVVGSQPVRLLVP